jgi:hypothetical protein
VSQKRRRKEYPKIGIREDLNQIIYEWKELSVPVYVSPHLAALVEGHIKYWQARMKRDLETDVFDCKSSDG